MSDKKQHKRQKQHKKENVGEKIKSNISKKTSKTNTKHNGDYLGIGKRKIEKTKNRKTPIIKTLTEIYQKNH